MPLTPTSRFMVASYSRSRSVSEETVYSPYRVTKFVQKVNLSNYFLEIVSLTFFCPFLSNQNNEKLFLEDKSCKVFVFAKPNNHIGISNDSHCMLWQP